MRTRWLTAWGCGLLTATAALADPPTELPPLLPVPPAATPKPPPEPPRGGPVADYDPGYLYLPERAPERPTTPEVGVPRGHTWFMPTLELGWSQSAVLPPLVRTAGTTVNGKTVPGPAVVGDERLSAPFRPGLGLSVGTWFDGDHLHSVEGVFYFLGSGGSDSVIAASPGQQLLLPTARGPDALDPATASFALTRPGYGTGVFRTDYETSYAAADVNARRNVLRGPHGRLDLLAGYRYVFVGEELGLTAVRANASGGVTAFGDRFETANHFHGGEVGFAAETRVDGWYVGGTAKVALGAVFARTDADGESMVNGLMSAGGFYARPAVAGRRSDTRFAVMPTLGLSLGRKVGDHTRAFLGYSFQYLSGITRPGNVLDPTPDPYGTGAGMERDSGTADFWVQTLNLGLEVRY